MKLLKKLVPILLSLLMAITMLPISAMATATSTKGSLTINKDGSASTFTIYRIYDMAVGTASDVYTYTPDANFVSFFNANKTITPQAISAYTSAQLDTLTSELQTAITTGNLLSTASKTATLTSGTTYSAVFSGLDLGYYLVVETGTTGAKITSKAFLVSVPQGTTGTSGTTTWNYCVTPTLKDSTPTFNKTIVKGGADVATATQNIGDIVNYRLDADVPQYDPNATNITFKMTDIMSKGLTFNNDSSLVVSGYNSVTTTTTTLAPTAYAITPTTNTTTGITTLTINFVYANIKNYSSVKVVYTATLNKDAVIGGSLGNPNEAYLTYTNSPCAKTTVDTPHVKPIVYTTGIAITKKDSATSAKLAGAVFTLTSQGKQLAVYTYGADGTTRILSSNSGFSVATDTTGMTYFLGLDAGTYIISETTAPSGYSLLSAPITVVITAIKDSTSGKYTGVFHYTIDNKPESIASLTKINDILIDVQVTDDKGYVLPGTGGIGTIIFTVGGIAIILLGSCLALVYNKKRKRSAQH
jgi:fimbrial isopeptide formation D2 family protein/LPXTG-motif cell wall-anchored protein